MKTYADYIAECKAVAANVFTEPAPEMYVLTKDESEALISHHCYPKYNGVPRSVTEKVKAYNKVRNAWVSRKNAFNRKRAAQLEELKQQAVRHVVRQIASGALDNVAADEMFKQIALIR